MSHEVEVVVTLKYRGERVVLSDSEWGVRLNDDAIQASAANLAYGLVEEMWGRVDNTL